MPNKSKFHNQNCSPKDKVGHKCTFCSKTFEVAMKKQKHEYDCKTDKWYVKSGSKQKTGF